MKIYHTATQKDYDSLMIKLELQGCKFTFSGRPTTQDIFDNYKGNTHIFNEDGILSFSNSRYVREHYSDLQIIEYKAKGEIMDEKQFKQQSHDLVIDIASTIGTYTINLEFTDDDLAKTQELVKKFDENLTEFIDSRKPKFEIGDYITNVTSDNERTFIGVVSVINLDMHDGLFYHREKNELLRIIVRTELGTVRHATPEEITEYKAALNFHEHGRKPFEVRKGDILRDDNGNIFFVDYPNIWEKEYFTIGDYTFVKTAEEANEWLENK